MASGSRVKRDLQQGEETAEWQHFREEITCSICGDIFPDPKTIIPCLHTFCKRCIENSIESNKKMAAVVCCPLCRTPLSQGEITSIPSNFTISRLVEIFMQREQEKGEVSVTISRLVEIFGQQQKVGTTASVETTCGNCEENLPVTMWCTECEDPLCHDCSELHKKIKAYKAHEVILINQFLSDPKQVLRIAISEKVDFCKTHINQMVDHYCKTCSKLVCQECVSQGRPLGHRYHSVSSVEDVLDEKRERIKEILVPLKQLLRQMRNGVKKIERCEDQIDKDSEASIEEIQATYDEQYRILKQQEEDAVEKVHIIQDSLKNTLALQKENVQLMESQMASCIDFYENIVKISRAKELIHYNDWIENRVVELNNRIEHTSLDPQCKASHMAVKCKPVVNESLCDVSSVPICKVMEGPAVIDRLIKLTVTLKDHSAAAVPIVNQSKDIEIHCNKEKKFLQKKQVKEQLEGQYEIRYNPKRMECHLLCIRWRGIAMNHEKIQVLVNVRDYSSIKEVVMVINSYGPIDIDPYGGGLMNRQLANPCFLAKGPDNKLYVRDSNCDVLVVFDEQYQYSHIIGGHGRGLGRFLCMTGIAVDKKGYLYIADRELHCIQKLNQRSGNLFARLAVKVVLMENSIVLVVYCLHQAYCLCVTLKITEFKCLKMNNSFTALESVVQNPVLSIILSI
ncbi:E3 ubiquitin-protein ligase TRIM71-like [Dysidea avara]|uniref:E3 ubiquitin-protein ligase TRIM71-like n=1 Tax=Dysidea avara TaxID=196820 RepID=UPI0033233F3A